VAEDTAYFQSIVANRALLLDEQEALEGGVLVSIETAEDQQQEEDIWVWLQEHFGQFLRLLRHLPSEDQELLLSYYLLGKTQNTLATIHHSTQTVCSFKIRMAVKNLCVFLMMGEPTQETMGDILIGANLEYPHPLGIPLSQLIWEYARCRDFARLAKIHNIHRPDIRRAMSRASKALLEMKGREHALGAYIYSLIDKANPAGQGYTKRKLAKQGHIVKTDPPITGQFRIDVTDPDFEAMFTSRANR
jgi:hypothetical protein